MKDYDAIHFTEEEKRQLIIHRDMICKYILDTIIPHMVSDQRVIIDFGATYKNMGVITTEYHLVVHETPHLYPASPSCGLNDRYISIGVSRRFGHVVDFEKTKSPYRIFPVIDNWDLIKRKLYESHTMEGVGRNNIYNFHV